MATITWVAPTTKLPEIGKDIIIKYQTIDSGENYAKASFRKVYNSNNTGNDFNALIYFADGISRTVKSITISNVVGYADFYEGWEADIEPPAES